MIFNAVRSEVRIQVRNTVESLVSMFHIGETDNYPTTLLRSIIDIR